MKTQSLELLLSRRPLFFLQRKHAQAIRMQKAHVDIILVNSLEPRRMRSVASMHLHS